MDNAQGQVQCRTRSELAELRTEIRLLEQGTPIRIRTSTGPRIVTFLEMKRTRLIFEDSDGVCYSIRAEAFLGIAEGDIPKRFQNPRATRLLHQTCERGDLAEIQRLISDGADINARSHENDGGRVPLEDAIEYGQLEAVRLLLDQGAEVNVRNRYGGTPLKLAAVMGDESIVRELLDKGADVNARDYYGTPEDWAARLHRTAIVEMLKTHQQP
ncbi:MAG: ankyrin repeat domain-containing protein [Sedimentisphaerales bacterium]|nr:ankyrin repeat domain-containing protein [Sedimentisphaerales bacterium]